MKEVYLTDTRDRVRFALGKYDQRPLVVFGLNPSTATLQQSDLTLTKVKNFALQMNFDGYLMLNLYPLRATHPKELPLRASTQLMKQNLAYIHACLTDIRMPTVWAAWGNGIANRGYFRKSLQKIMALEFSAQSRWVHVAALTRKGHPRHPSRLPYRATIHTFDPNAYLNR